VIAHLLLRVAPAAAFDPLDEGVRLVARLHTDQSKVCGLCIYKRILNNLRDLGHVLLVGALPSRVATIVYRRHQALLLLTILLRRPSRMRGARWLAIDYKLSSHPVSSS